MAYYPSPEKIRNLRKAESLTPHEREINKLIERAEDKRQKSMFWAFFLGLLIGYALF